MTESSHRCPGCSLKVLMDFRDNMHKKIYLRRVTGSTKLLDNLNYILRIAEETHYDANEKILEKFHSVLFRIGSRLLTRIFHDEYLEKDYKKISLKYKKLCLIKNRYWRKIKNGK